MAGVKGLPRALEKLTNYIEERKKKGLPVESVLYECKDLLRCSFVTETADDSLAIIDALKKENDFFTV